jgi:hypothetical protein
MATVPRSVKITLTISLLSLLIYVTYVLRGSYVILFDYLSGLPSAIGYVTMLGPAFWASHIGITARFIGVLLGLAAVFLLLIKSWPFRRVKPIVAAALVLEAVSFLGLVPSLWILLSPGSRLFTPNLGYGYLIQILVAVPTLLALAYVVASYKGSPQRAPLLRVGAAAFVGYVVALVTNEVSRWVSMLSLESLQFVEGIRAVGLVNAVVFMPFAVVFAVIGAWRLSRQKIPSAMWWLGASLLVVGLNYCIYLGFAVAVNALNTLPVVDIWTLPLAALGAALIVASYGQRRVNALN